MSFGSDEAAIRSKSDRPPLYDLTHRRNHVVKMLMLGATGATGRLLTSLALKDGHAVRALVRDAGAARLPTPVRAVQGDARSESDVASAMSGVDVVVSALGMGLKTTPDGLMVDAARALIAAGASTGVRRLVMLSSWGVGETLRRSSLLTRLVYQAGKAVHDEKARAEVELRASDLDWTLLYPVALTNGPPSGNLRLRDLDEVVRMRGISRISRADVAEAMLDIAVSGERRRRTVVLDAPRHVTLR